MVIVGTGLLPKHFTALLRNPLPLITATLLQAILLPLLAWIVLELTEPELEIAIGLILVATSPGGALSNYYCHLGCVDTALSVVLTAASSVLAFFMMPVILAISLTLLLGEKEIDVDLIDLIIQLVAILLAPLVFGMLLRYWFSSTVEATANAVRSASLILVAALLALIIVDQWSTTQRIFFRAAWVTLFFTFGAVVLGWLSGLWFRMREDQRYATAIEFAVRNAGIAAVVAASSLGRPELAAFSALFVVFQFPIVVFLLGLYRAREHGAGA